ncbi:MAG: cytochrome c family protein [Planctomycetales bacterium]|nr:cytochrome c family protein [Planctomycetales bacterium]
MKRQELIVIAMVLFFLTGAYCLGQEDPRNNALDVHLNPHDVMGYESCGKCHAAEIKVWKQTPHHGTFLTLHRKPEAQQIASRLGIQSFKSESECVKCHYTLQEKSTSSTEAISGISCESCHGAARDWLEVHNDYGGAGITRESESAQHRFERLQASINGGMRNPVNVYLLAQSCYRCHTVPSERLVNVGGHNVGSLDFELVAWSQGTVRHNFVRSNGQTNDPSSQERLRLMFVAGMVADLEFSLRATANATEKETFGINSAKRAARAAKRLVAAQTQLKLAVLDEILQIYQGVSLKLNNQTELLEAADAIHMRGVQFAATIEGSQLAAIDAYIPSPDRWK